MLRRIFALIEIVILSALILTIRCANYEDVFVNGNIYFTDADCYSRMTRVRMCAEHPGLIIRHHNFENYPNGTTPHTTAPFDYLIVGLSKWLAPFTAQPIDLAGALISPVLALICGWFLWWWSLNFRHRWLLLVLFAISPILVHGTELGRPDHQSLLLLLIAIAICAEWRFQQHARVTEWNSSCLNRWSVVSGSSWALAIWVSAYEPVILFLLTSLAVIFSSLNRSMVRFRTLGAVSFVLIIAIALLIERRIPRWPALWSNPIFDNWSSTIGELAHVSPTDPVWLSWSGYFLLLVPLFIWFSFRNRNKIENSLFALPLFVVLLLVASYGLTIWQARWGYFFMLLFALSIPAFLEEIRSRAAIWIAFTLSLVPIGQEFDRRIWSQTEAVHRAEQRLEGVRIHDLAVTLRSPEVHPFLAPWWVSPSVAYWSNQPGVAGSSHESLAGLEAGARFFLSTEAAQAREILQAGRVEWVVAGDSGRVATNSAAILGSKITGHELCFVLDRTPARKPDFLILSGQNGVAKLYRVANNL